MNKKRLEILLSKLEPRPKSRLRWEGYQLDSQSASAIINVASRINNDVAGRSVIDLGCGSGILAISAWLLGSRCSTGIDIDKESIRVSRLNAESVGAEIDFIVGDINCIMGRFDTTLMNPPFGSWNRGADALFLEKSLEISSIIYSVHKRSQSVRRFIRSLVDSLGGEIDQSFEIDINIPRLFDFHRKKKYTVHADLYRILNKWSGNSKTNI